MCATCSRCGTGAASPATARTSRWDGYQWCKAKDGRPVPAFRDSTDPDYRAILEAIRTAKSRQEQGAGRPDMPGFRAPEHYVRWMKRWGVLGADLDPAADPINVYETDQKYWRSLWYQPTIDKTAGGP